MPIRAIRCEVFSRVCGYFMPVECWNLGKREEFKDRASVNLDTHAFDVYDKDKEEEEHD